MWMITRTLENDEALSINNEHTCTLCVRYTALIYISNRNTHVIRVKRQVVEFHNSIICNSFKWENTVTNIRRMSKQIIVDSYKRHFLSSSAVKNLPVQKTWAWSLGREDPLEKEMATHSSILAWEILWTKDLGGLQPMGSRKSGTQLKRLNNNIC